MLGKEGLIESQVGGKEVMLLNRVLVLKMATVDLSRTAITVKESLVRLIGRMVLVVEASRESNKEPSFVGYFSLDKGAD